MTQRRVRWKVAMANALYGEGGFYRSSGAPARHFRTAAHAVEAWARAVRHLAERVDSALGEPAGFTLLDMGAGGGELLGALAVTAPARWRLAGVDLAPRPTALPPRVQWWDEPPARVLGMAIANEWLDVVPADVVELTDDGPRYVTVAADGSEALGEPVAGADLDWLRRWWPLAEAGDRAEVGAPRDAAWRDLTRRLDRGLAIAIDYAAEPACDVAGTLTGYRAGRHVMPVPDGSCDITAHVRFDSLAAPGDVVVRQREALRALGIEAGRPQYGGDPAAYLAALSATADAAELLDPSGLGGFTWLLHPVGVNLDGRLHVEST